MAGHEVPLGRLSRARAEPGTTQEARTHGATEPLWARRVAVVAGAMMVGGAAWNSCMVIARPGSYSGMGGWFQEVSPWDLGPLPGLWSATFGEHPRVFVPVVGVGFEAAVGALALSRDPRRRVAGLTGVAAFHAALLGMGLWAWAVPWLGVLVPTIAVTARSARRRAAGGAGR